MTDMKSMTIRHHFHLCRSNGFLSLAFRKIILVKMFMNNAPTLADIYPNKTMNMSS